MITKMGTFDEIIEGNLSLIEDINKLATSSGWFPVSRVFDPSAFTLELFYKPCSKNHVLSDEFSHLLLDAYGYNVRIYYQSKVVSVVIYL